MRTTAPRTDRSGLLVTALLAGSLAGLVTTTLLATALGLAPLRALAAGALTTLGISTVAALVLGVRLGLHRPAPVPDRVIVLPGPTSLARRDALELVQATEARLLRAVEVAAPEAELLGCALDLQAARLRLARVLLDEEGAVPQPLQDELNVAHRGTSAWLRTSRLS